MICDACGISVQNGTTVKMKLEIEGARYTHKQVLDTELHLCRTCLCHLPDLLSAAMVVNRIVGAREVFRYILPNSKVLFSSKPLTDEEIEPSLEDLTKARLTMPEEKQKRHKAVKPKRAKKPVVAKEEAPTPAPKRRRRKTKEAT